MLKRNNQYWIWKTNTNKKIRIKIQKFINLGCPEFGKIIMKNYEQKEVYPSIKKALKI